jgi:hypothetical protein
VTSLRDFIAARLKEDFDAATAAGSGRWVHEGRGRVEDDSTDDSRDYVVVYDEGSPTEAQADHIARHDPARVLREVAAKRAILGEFEQCMTELNAADRCTDPTDGLLLVGKAAALNLVVGHLAALYSDHPDFDPNWSTT